jgi:hypothetical protein
LLDGLLIFFFVIDQIIGVVSCGHFYTGER